MDELLLGIPGFAWVSIAAALSAVIATALNINAMRKPLESSAAAELTDSAGALVDRMEIRLTKIEGKHCELEEKYCKLEEEYEALEKTCKEIFEGGKLNIEQLEGLNVVPKYCPENLVFGTGRGAS